MTLATQQENVVHSQEKEQPAETVPEGAQILGLGDKGFKLVIMHLFKEL
jgi:hypothetical protein